jgi:hypothetical protein
MLDDTDDDDKGSSGDDGDLSYALTQITRCVVSHYYVVSDVHIPILAYHLRMLMSLILAPGILNLLTPTKTASTSSMQSQSYPCHLLITI